MRRMWPVLLVAVAALVIGVGTAGAESVTVKGDKIGPGGDITKIVANNAKGAVQVRVFGLGKPCGGAKSLSVSITNAKKRLLYQATGGCYGANTWGTGLAYTATGDPNDVKTVKCPKLVFKWMGKAKAYRVNVPRPCLKRAPNKVRVEVDGSNWGSVTGGHAGPTKALRRG